ncbi:MAG: hypothetical protein ACYSU7_06760 [Planctomycetota bacterium]|jgi:hypothetical protein
MFWIANMLMGAAGGAMVAIGWRGRLLDDHRYCRRCRYDLAGSPADEPRCPECGADLTGRRAVRHGRRARRRWALALGGVLLVLAAAGTVLFATQVDWTTYKPVWLLRQDLASGNPTVALRARQEVLRRINAGAMPDRAIRRFVDEALAIQADSTVPWDTFWGDVFEAARPQGHATEADRQRFLKTAFDHSASLLIRPSARAGSDVMLYVDRRRARVGSQVSYRSRMEFGAVRLGDHEVSEAGRRSGGGIIAASSSGRGGGGIRIDVPPGTYTVSVDIEVSIRGATVPDDEPLVRWTKTFTAPLRVEPDDADVVGRRPDAAFEEVLCDLVKVRQCALDASRGSWRARVNLDLPQPPVSVAFDVFWRQGDREWLVGALVVPAGSRSKSLAAPPGLHRPPALDGFPAWVETVDVVLRTNPRLAEATVDIIEVWDGEIVLPDVRLERTPP